MHELPIYPKNHLVGMKVPWGGSNCAKCEYVHGQNCSNKLFQKWNGGRVIPGNVNAYCCDFFEEGKPKPQAPEPEPDPDKLLGEGNGK